MRLICTLALTSLLVACAPPKAVEVAEEPVVKPKTNRPAAVEAPEPLKYVQHSGMKTPDLTQRLPDSRDMRATTDLPKQDGPTVRAKPPGASE